VNTLFTELHKLFYVINIHALAGEFVHIVPLFEHESYLGIKQQHPAPTKYQAPSLEDTSKVQQPINSAGQTWQIIVCLACGFDAQLAIDVFAM